MAVVRSPMVAPPDVGLIASLSGEYLDPPDEILEGGVTSRWETGFRYNPEQMAAASTGSAFDPCLRPTRTIGANIANVSAMPFVCWMGDACSPFGFEARDFVARARRALLAAGSKQIAHEMWTGAVAGASGGANAYRASDALAGRVHLPAVHVGRSGSEPAARPCGRRVVTSRRS